MKSNIIFAKAIMEDYNNAQKTLPSGINTSTNIMKSSKLGDSSIGKDQDGSNKTLNTTKVATDSYYNPEHNVIKLTSADNASRNQVGAVWSSDNYTFNYNKETETIKLWLYFSGATKVGSPENDGMAFVLQNDTAADTHAISRYYYSSFFTGPAGGQTLGVYGTDRRDEPKTEELNISAIQNSWALEFDSHFNGAASLAKDISQGPTSNPDFGNMPNSFDNDPSLSAIKGSQHIASSYPVEFANQVTYNILTKTSPYTQTHINPQPVNLTDNSWHHVILKWVKNPDSGSIVTGNIILTFDDIYPDGTPNNSSNHLSNIVYPVNTAAFNSENGIIRWGITGSSGSAVTQENNFAPNNSSLAIVEQAPNALKGNAKNRILNAANSDVTSGDELPSNTNFTINYDINLEDAGIAGKWSNIIAKLPLPQDATGGTTQTTLTGATIHYYNSDGSLNSNLTETLDSTNTSITNANTNKTFAHTLSQSLTPDLPKATVTLNATTNAVKSADMSTAVAKFTGNEYVATTFVPSFKLSSARTITPTANSLDQTALNNVSKANGIPDIGGTFTYKDISNTSLGIKNDTFKVNYYFDNNSNSLNSYNVSETVDQTTTEKQSNYLLNSDKVSLEGLSAGTHTLSYFISDSLGNISATITVNFTIQGSLELSGIPSTLTFTPTVLTGQKMLIKRNGDSANAIINVTDDRQSFAKWYLDARVEAPMAAGTKKLAGDLVYQQTGNVGTKILNTEYQNVFENTTQNANTPITWNDNTGLVLQTAGNATAGEYTGTVEWTLSDVPH